MNAPAAFRASYADWKLIKTRGVVSISFEVPLNESHLAYEALGGMPAAASEVWCAVARLSQSPAEKPTANAGGYHEVAGPKLQPPRQEPSTPDGAKTPKCAPPYGENCTEPFNWDDNVPYCDTCGMFRSNEAHHRIPKAAPKTDFRDMRLAKQAGRMCKEIPFQKFLTEKLKWSNPGPFTSEHAADYVRRHCNVASRSDIRPRTPSGDRWQKLFEEYQVWMHHPAEFAA